jgi:hypothetical protein
MEESSCNEKFKHAPLSLAAHEIRLCRLEELPKGNSEGISIHCTIEHHDLSEAKTQYKALSYTWGEERPLHTILIKGQPFRIRQNLFDFLVQKQQDGDYANWFWVDQLCIDQDNIAELNHQVQQMADIYSGAEEVWVWLGSSADNSDMAMDALEGLSRVFLNHEQDSGFWGAAENYLENKNSARSQALDVLL